MLLLLLLLFQTRFLDTTLLSDARLAVGQEFCE